MNGQRSKPTEAGDLHGVGGKEASKIVGNGLKGNPEARG
jgi:hypothetical protein